MVEFKKTHFDSKSKIATAFIYTNDMHKRCKVFEVLPETEDEKLKYLNTSCCVRVKEHDKGGNDHLWYNHYLMWYDKKFYYKYRILFENTRM